VTRRAGAIGFLVWILCVLAPPVFAGQLDRAMLEKEFPAPLMVGQKDDALPIWPILKQNGGAIEVFAYAFESADFAAINGFGGEPVDMLVALGPDGSFKDVKVLSQHEPVFVDGLGPEPLFNFVQQYIGLSARHTLRVGRPNARSNGASPLNVVDGVAMATASTRVINESLLGSALAVARKKLGFGAASTVGLRVIAKDDTFETLSWADLLKRGWVKDLRLTNADVDKAFADSNVPPEGADKPDDVFAETYVAYLNVPSIGRNLLGDKLYKNVMGWLGPGDHAILVVAAGPWSPLGDDFVLGSIPDRVQVVQDRLAINARDLAIERTPGDGIKGLPEGQWTILKVVEEGGFDPSKPWQLTEKVTRERGQILAEKVTREFSDTYSLPDALFKREKPDAGPTWVDSWRARVWELVALGAMLAVLVPVLIRQKGLVADQKRFSLFRIAYLALTLGFIGWYAQAQLSIVTLVGLVRNARSADFTFLLYDPPSLMLWAFVLVTLFIWGRGTFCGWLCPFGALQELVALPTKWLRIPQVVVPPRVDRVLRNVKYVVLAGILVGAAVSTPLSDSLVEVEPFKTSITLYFVRFWPFVAYAIGLLVLNLFVYKGFCRYLCPLGASLALVGRVRIFNWIPRRAECGTPCQLCKVKCRYGAIEPAGAINYPECFQCMDCVTIINDPTLCVPQIIERKRGRTIEPQPIAAE
jgi:NosR/NirI family nitrous oxide reductase transcriptional regulator